MRKLFLIIAATLLLCGGAFAQQDKDTISYPDWRYFYPPLDTASACCPSNIGNSCLLSSPGYVGNLQFKVLQPLRIYGIAITPTTGTNGPVFVRTFGGDTVHYEPDPPDVDSSTLDLYAVLIQQEDSLFVHVDSAKWHRRDPDKYFRYRTYRNTWGG